MLRLWLCLAILRVATSPLLGGPLRKQRPTFTVPRHLWSIIDPYDSYWVVTKLEFLEQNRTNRQLVAAASGVLIAPLKTTWLHMAIFRSFSDSCLLPPKRSLVCRICIMILRSVGARSSESLNRWYDGFPTTNLNAGAWQLEIRVSRWCDPSQLASCED